MKHFHKIHSKHFLIYKETFHLQGCCSGVQLIYVTYHCPLQKYWCSTWSSPFLAVNCIAGSGWAEIILRIHSRSRNYLIKNIDCTKVRIEAAKMNTNLYLPPLKHTGMSYVQLLVKVHFKVDGGKEKKLSRNLSQYKGWEFALWAFVWIARF